MAGRDETTTEADTGRAHATEARTGTRGNKLHASVAVGLV